MIRRTTADIEVSIIVKACPTFVFFVCRFSFPWLDVKEISDVMKNETSLHSWGGGCRFPPKTCKYCLPVVSLSAAVCLNERPLLLCL